MPYLEDMVSRNRRKPMSRLEIKVDGEHVGAATMLDTARLTLKMLHNKKRYCKIKLGRDN